MNAVEIIEVSMEVTASSGRMIIVGTIETIAGMGNKGHNYKSSGFGISVTGIQCEMRQSA